MGGEEVMDVTNIRRDRLILGNFLQKLGDRGSFSQTWLASHIYIVTALRSFQA